MVVVVVVGFGSVVLLLLLSRVIVAVGQRTVIVLVGVPVAFVFPAASQAFNAFAMVVGHVIVIVRMSNRLVRMLGLLTLALRGLADLARRRSRWELPRIRISSYHR